MITKDIRDPVQCFVSDALNRSYVALYASDNPLSLVFIEQFKAYRKIFSHHWFRETSYATFRSFIRYNFILEGNSCSRLYDNKK